MWWEISTTSNKSQLDRFLCTLLLPSVLLCYPWIWLTKNVITTLLNRGKAPILDYDLMIQSPTLRSKSWPLWMLQFRPCCTQTGWIQYRYTQDYQKNGQFTAVVCPNSLWQSNWKTPGLSVITSYLCLIYFKCDSILCLELFCVWG